MRKLFYPVALFACIAFVQTAASAAAPDPSDPRVAVPPVRYESSFARYRALQDDPALSWKSVNELVHKLGGWSAYAGGKVPDEPKAAQARPPSAGGKVTDEPKAAQARPPSAPAPVISSEGAHAGHGKR